MYPFGESRLLNGSVGPHAFKGLMVTMLSLAFVAGGVALCVYTPDWRWGLGLMGFFALGPIMFVPALLRTGRYELTTARLVWRPFFGAPREILLADISPGDVQYDGSSGSVEIPRLKLRMAAVGDRHRLWGGLLVYSALSKLQPPAAQAGRTQALYWRANTGSGFRTMSGIAVLGPDYVAFVPSYFVPPPRSLPERLATVATGLGLAAVGLVRIPVLPWPPIPTEQMIAMLAQGSQAFFDSAIERLVVLMGGRLIARSSVQLGGAADPGVVEIGIDGEVVRAKLDPTWAADIRKRFEMALYRGPGR
jgi:hypothetical protein